MFTKLNDSLIKIYFEIFKLTFKTLINYFSYKYEFYYIFRKIKYGLEINMIFSDENIRLFL